MTGEMVEPKDELPGAAVLFLRHLVADGGSEAGAFESLCERNPDESVALRRLRRRFARSRERTSVLGHPPGLATGRYRPIRFLGRTGDLATFEAWEEVLERLVVLRVALLPEPSARPGESRGDPTEQLLHEAAITARLDHPGVMPVHELATDGDGRLFLASCPPSGRTLSHLLEMVRRKEDDWTRARVLETLIQVCRTLEFAHSRGVVHGNLHSECIVVGEFGEVVLSGWEWAVSSPPIDPSRLEIPVREELDEKSWRTAAGADGELLFEEREDCTNIRAREPTAAREPDPAPVDDLRAIGTLLDALLSAAGDKSDAELVAVVQRSTARSPEECYASPGELADDLQAFLERRVVRAHAVGARAEFVKWAQRNRAAAVLVAGTIAMAISILAWTTFRSRGDREALVLLRSVGELDQLIVEAEHLWPPVRSNRDWMASWLTRAETLLERSSEFRGRLDSLREEMIGERAGDGGGEGQSARWLFLWYPMHRLRVLNERIATLEAALARTPTSTDPTTRDWRRTALSRALDKARKSRDVATASVERHDLCRQDDLLQEWESDALTRLLKDLGRFGQQGLEKGSGAVAAVRGALERLDLWLGDRNEEIERRWEAATASIADPGECPMYDGTRIELLFGLVPLERDPTTELWEFWAFFTGAEPVRDSAGQWCIEEETGMVFVLVPGGTLPGTEREVAPCLVSKYEMTQAQARRFRESRSYFSASSPDGKLHLTSYTHPEEQISFSGFVQLTERMGMALPTELQWEYAARAGCTTRWWTGDDPRAVLEAEVLRDRTDDQQFVPRGLERFRDGPIRVHQPVGGGRANGFGLYDVQGNVAEWCQTGSADNEGAVRGGSFLSTPEEAAFGPGIRRGDGAESIGARPIWSLTAP